MSDLLLAYCAVYGHIRYRFHGKWQDNCDRCGSPLPPRVNNAFAQEGLENVKE